MWKSVLWDAPFIVRRFVLSFQVPVKAEREAAIAAAVVDMWMLLDPLLPTQTGKNRIKLLVSKYVPLIAAEFGA